jgi:hypothetical protein
VYERIEKPDVINFTTITRNIFWKVLHCALSSVSIPYLPVCRSRKEPHHFGGAGAVTRCGSGSDGFGSKLNYEHRWISKKCHKL